MAALQVADIFDARAAEAPIHRLVAVLNTQAAQIRKLQESMRVVQATQRQTLSDCNALRAAVSPLEPRVQTTESDVAALQQFKAVAQQQLQAMSLQLQAKADRRELQDAEIRAKTRSEETSKELCSQLASLQLVQCLQTEQSELHERLETVDRRLAAKMDKSEAARLDGVLVQIHGFRPLAAQLSAQVEQVQTQQSNMERSVARLETLDAVSQAHHIELEEIRQHADELQQMLDKAEDRHRRAVISQNQRLDDSTEQLQHALDQVKTAAATSEAALRTLSAKFHSSAGAFASQIEQQYHHFEQLVEKKAPRLEIDAQIADLSRQVASKVPHTTHKALVSGVKDLRSRCEKLQEHVELSTRFLDWFARRGEAYEHNLELVETQLGRLALAAHPQSREPFGGRVRFPRSP
ncbi:hypothetical protein PF005_g9934 [Phytophthora fragariae]|uniref:Uncharacterized protein n=1 Tax=Phytophthora fragariae TaxID=53985 RepID=A0A6A3ZLQ9_9STRA|nr:hypothetical protein PF003_g29584 [Phytophthora fragariae]KAE8937228.1 hypothetical protein PF009_g12869 [Phytophthora fragariae]KAE9012674.1 hypothetical protein PF011_g8811 [Phytophthora fragariae]KAE9115657.1 hypothetical protein PF007_g9940 [Phytophthora fragariae]KAE9119994.1 hypothetical protein PF010_g7664 [Phytophthora fragariae]